MSPDYHPLNICEIHSASDTLAQRTPEFFIVVEDDHSDDDDEITGYIDCEYSTNWTCDNNPGPGRIIDKYVYQFLGRKVERFLARVSEIDHGKEVPVVDEKLPPSLPHSEQEDLRPNEDHNALMDSQSFYSKSSSMATIDNNPGAGRTLDTYFFQPLGRMTEKAISCLLLRALPVAFPAENIVRSLIDVQDRLGTIGDINVYQHADFAEYAERKNIAWVLPGLYALVKQSS